VSAVRLSDTRGAMCDPVAEARIDMVIERFEHVYEVDPNLMQRFSQQEMPAWDTHRIVAARWDHIADVHRQFADSVVLAGEGPDAQGDPG
jgi:hypothetical protein